MPISDVTVADPDGATVALAPSTGSAGERLMVLPVDSSTFLTVELRPAEGYDDHLPEGGLAIHRVRVDGSAVAAIDPLNGEAPFTDLLQPGENLTADGWVVQFALDGRVDARPSS
jgi:hypothetical protein